MKTTLNTGALELRGLYQRFVTEGLMIAGLLHFMIIGGYQIFSKIFDGTDTRGPKLPPIIIDVFLPPPTLHPTPIIPNPILSVTQKPSIGTPVPRPDAEINPEMTIATQEQMNEALNAISPGEHTGTTEFVYNGGKIENEEVPPDFRIVEIDPKVVNRVNPIYPEIARRAGVEGTVLIKMWVTKEGKVKKSEIMNSTNELFDQAALDAAKQWTFTPAIMNNGPVDVWVRIPFKFRLASK